LLELPFPEGPGTRIVRVLGLIDKRVGAPEARAACEEVTPEEVVEQRKLWSEARSQRLAGDQGRPTKKNRRALEERRGFFE
jgi:ribosome-associated heat shock protein Hsp15